MTRPDIRGSFVRIATESAARRAWPCASGRGRCAPKQTRLATLEAAARARLLTYRVVLTLQVDQAVGSPASWDWPNRLGLRPPEGVVARVERLGETASP